MKITQVVCQILRVPNVQAKTASSQDSVLVRVRTDTGLEGIGEADSSPEVVKSIIDAPFSHNIACGLREILVGENPLETERLWQKMYRRTMYYGRTSVAITAMAAVDIALWDLKGKLFNQPIHRLLGGQHLGADRRWDLRWWYNPGFAHPCESPRGGYGHLSLSGWDARMLSHGQRLSILLGGKLAWAAG